MSPSLSLLLNAQVNPAVVKCGVANNQRVFHAAVFAGSKPLLKAMLIVTTLIDRITSTLFTTSLVSPVYVSPNAAAAATVEPDFVTN